MAEINVTPFVDVMLVLLIVFMVTAPLLTVGVPVDLPKTRAQTLGQDNEPLSVTVKRDGGIFLQNTPIAEDELVRQAHGHRRQWLRPAHLRARRQGGRLRPRHGSDGPSFRRRLHPHWAGDRCRKA
ncbi:MAG: biopolymer transporter ExbD [Rhizomicrobium sp.]